MLRIRFRLYLSCIKIDFLSQADRLSDDCLNFVRMRIEEAALDYRLDPVLEEACADDVSSNADT